MKENIKRVLEILGSEDDFYLATAKDGKPNVRPFDVHCEFEDKIYIVTKKHKNVYKEIKANPHVAIARSIGKDYYRVFAELVEDERREAREKLVNDNVEACKGKYAADDNDTAVFYLKDAVMNLMSHGKEPEVIKF